MDRTGFALGNLSPIIYFKRKDGFVVLASYDTGKPEQARMMHQARFSDWEFCETRNLSDVDWLQNKLVGQELEEAKIRDSGEDFIRAEVFRQTGSNLRQRMVSAGCSDYEKEFIRHYLQLRETKRDPYRQRWSEHQNYLWIREFDSTSKIEDRMKGDLSL